MAPQPAAAPSSYAIMESLFGAKDIKSYNFAGHAEYLFSI